MQVILDPEFHLRRKLTLFDELPRLVTRRIPFTRASESGIGLSIIILNILLAKTE